MRSKYTEFILNDLEKDRKRKFNFKKWLKYTFPNIADVNYKKKVLLNNVKDIYIQEVMPTLTLPKVAYPLFSKAYDRAIRNFSNEEIYTLFELYDLYINFKISDNEDKQIKEYLHNKLITYLLVYCH